MLKQIGIGIGCLVGWVACAAAAEAPAPAPPPVAAAPAAARSVVAAPAEQHSDTWLLHLPGISGRRWIDDQMVLGLRDAGYGGALDIYDWTGADPGLGSLLAYKRNQAEAQKVADLIAQRLRKQPKLKIILSGHSGGTGVAVWALEKLPPGMKVEKLVLLASALSPDYDLSAALAHVSGTCYSFCSENDVLVLGAGTKMFGTIDGKKTEAAGEIGFCFPATADAKQYEKLIQKPYDRRWMKYRNFGDHVGCMLRGFSQAVIAPLIVPALPVTVQAAKPAAETNHTPVSRDPGAASGHVTRS